MISICTSLSFLNLFEVVTDFDVEYRRSRDKDQEEDFALKNTHYEGTCMKLNDPDNEFVFIVKKAEQFYNSSLPETRKGRFENSDSLPERVSCFANKDDNVNTFLLDSPNQYPIEMSRLLTNDIIEFHQYIDKMAKSARLIISSLYIILMIIYLISKCIFKIKRD